MFTRTRDHFLTNVLSAVDEYASAEATLSAALQEAGGDKSKCPADAERAKRRAADAAVAIDGLADRAAKATGRNPNDIRAAVSKLCEIDGKRREGTVERVCAVANAYKHDQLDNKRHPITSNDDVLVVGAGYGIDSFSAGKFDGIEVMVHQTDGKKRKFLADVPFAVAGWVNFLEGHGVALPSNIVVCGKRIR